MNADLIWLMALPFLVMIVGLVLWTVQNKPMMKDVGRVMFPIGLFVLLLIIAWWGTRDFK